MNTNEARGFNYDGSWGTSGLDLWMHHEAGTMAVEVARGKRYFPGWNLARWWLSNDAFQRQPEKFVGNFEAGLATFAAYGIRVMPVLFNRWRDPVCDFGGVSLEHLVPAASYGFGERVPFSHWDDAQLLEPHSIDLLFWRYLESVVGRFADDERIFAWDLCNEPLMGPYIDEPDSPLLQGELQWLRWCYRVCKTLGAKQPLTIGHFPSLKALELTASISDFLSFHPYYIWNLPSHPLSDKRRYEMFVDECIKFADENRKSLLASETVWGAIDDARHVEVMRYTLGVLRERGLGFIVHALHHSLVADLHMPEYGPVGVPEALHFINPDGSLRAGHEAFNEFV
jgi:hypothetical protein